MRWLSLHDQTSLYLLALYKSYAVQEHAQKLELERQEQMAKAQPPSKPPSPPPKPFDANDYPLTR